MQFKFSRTEKFKKDYQALQEEVKKAVNKQVIQLMMDHTHPSLNLEKLVGFTNVYSVRVNINYRISLSIEAEEIIFRRVLNHEDLYRRP
jgi:mRNA-degrading endonuclease RelE of RelBE toxin-antitoxin system